MMTLFLEEDSMRAKRHNRELINKHKQNALLVMSKKVELEYELKTRSGSAVWALISTPIGLMK